MPPLDNPRHERFAQELAKGKSADEAYTVAGYKENRGNATTLKQNKSILGRVTELLAERELLHAQSTAKAIERVSLTKEWILERLVENAQRALQARQAKDADGTPIGDFKYEGTVANRALELLGKELGMFVDRREVGKPGDFTDLPDDELDRAIREKAAALGVALPADKKLN